MRVALINMPWASLDEPSIALSLLKSIAERNGHPTRVHYFNLHLGTRFISSGVYARLSFGLGIGEWIFSEHFFGRFQADGTQHASFTDLLGSEGLTDRSIEEILAVKSQVTRFVDHCYNQVDWREVDVVGFGTTFYQTLASAALARKIKEAHPDKIILFGGANCEGEMGEGIHRAFPFVDYVVSGEGDHSFPALLDCLENGTPVDEVRGIWHRVGGESRFTGLAPVVLDLDDLPTPDFGDYFDTLTALGAASAQRDLVWLEASRGCWWGAKSHCTFCGLNDYTIGGRDKSAERVLQEIDEVTRRYPVTRIKFADNILSIRHFSTLLPKIKERADNGFDVLIFFETKANLRKEQVRLLREAGVRTVQSGIESMNSRKLKLMKKGESAIQNIQLLKWASELGVYVFWNWLYGFPGETDDDLRSELQTLQTITHLYPPTATSGVMLERFSPYFENPEPHQIRIHGPEEYYRHIFPFPQDLLMKLAYTFDYEHDQGDLSHDLLMRMKGFITTWRRSYQPQKLYFKQAGDRLHIYDQRFNMSPKQITLKGERREAYLFCDKIRTLNEIEEHLRRGNGALSEGFVEGLLDELVTLKVMYREGNRFLSLALPFDTDYAVQQIGRSVIGESLANEMTHG